MLHNTSVSTQSSSMHTDPDWSALYMTLPRLVTHAVHALRISLWYGQEYDIVEDIVQETLLRLLQRIRMAERGEASPIGQIEHMATVIAYNCCRDLRRHDRRLSHFPSSVAEFEDRYLDTAQFQSDCSEEATEQVFLDALFALLAQEVNRFPLKQRDAILTELANTMCFEKQPSSLQQAFLAVGVDLREYQQALPEIFKVRSQHTALLYWAYKRMAQLPNVQAYVSNVEENILDVAKPMEQGDMEISSGDLAELQEKALKSGDNDQEDDQTASIEILIEKLSEPYQTAVRLHYLQKYSYTQIAKRLQISKGTVKSQVSRGMRMLNKLVVQDSTELEDQNGEEQGNHGEILLQIEELPVLYKAAVRLHCIEKCTYTQMASQLHMPKGTIKSLVSRGMRMLISPQIAG